MPVVNYTKEYLVIKVLIGIDGLLWNICVLENKWIC